MYFGVYALPQALPLLLLSFVWLWVQTTPNVLFNYYLNPRCQRACALFLVHLPWSHSVWKFLNYLDMLSGVLCCSFLCASQYILAPLEANLSMIEPFSCLLLTVTFNLGSCKGFPLSPAVLQRLVFVILICGIVDLLTHTKNLRWASHVGIIETDMVPKFVNMKASENRSLLTHHLWKTNMYMWKDSDYCLHLCTVLFLFFFCVRLL